MVPYADNGLRKPIIAIMLVIVAVHAFGQQRIVLGSDPLYEDLVTLLIEAGEAVPSTSGPFTVAELELMLARIHPRELDTAGLRTLSRLRRQLSGRSLYGEPEGLVIDVQPRVNIEGYVHTNWENPEWVRGYEDRLPALSIPISITMNEQLFALMGLQIRKEPIMLAEEPNAWGNIPTSLGHVDYQFPLRAFVSAGGDHWNIQLGRDAAEWGNGQTGNFMLSDVLEYHDFLRLSTFWQSFKYQAMCINLESWNPDHISTQSDLYRSYLLHRIEVRLFDRLNLAMSEGLSLEGKYQELRYFNPMMIFHNWFLNDRYGNIIFTIDGELTVTDGLLIYGQYVLDQKTSKFERDRYGAGAEPDSLGYLAGASIRLPFRLGHISVDFEGVYTTPWLYIISGQPDFTEERKRITNYVGAKYLESKPLGYAHGPDTILGYGSVGYRVSGLFDSRVSFLYRVQGENTLDTPHEIGPEAVAMRTPSGDVPETRTVLTLAGSVSPFRWVEIGAEVAWVHDTNDDHVLDATMNDLQIGLHLGVSY